jgi:hypothetical protein
VCTNLFGCGEHELLTPELSDAGGISRPYWQRVQPARIRSSDFVNALHFTTTDSSWLNQVELWFSKIARDVIAHGFFTSVKDLSRKLLHYIRAYNRQAKPFKWTYKSTRNRIHA